MDIESETQTRALVRVLSDIATDLASMEDIEDLFLAIVQRTRAITGADMAYLSLNDYERGETYIRKSDGVNTARYRAIRIPLGAGVLGKAATGLAAVTSSGYMEDDSLVHLPDIDEIVREEGVQSILGLPMHIRGKMQGALLIADRRNRKYAADTIALVDAIAKQAAVAIFYTGRVQELSATAATLDAQADAGEMRIRELSALFQYDQRWLAIVADKGGIEGVLALLREIYEENVEFIGPEGVPGDLRFTRALRVAATGGYPALVQHPQHGPVTVAAAEIGKKQYGYVVVQANLPVESRKALEHGAVYTAMAALSERFDADQRTSGGLLDDLIHAEDQVTGSLRGRLVQSGMSMHEPISVMALNGALETAELLRRLRSRMPRAIFAHHANHICVLHQGTPIGDFAQQLFGTAEAELRIGTASVRDLNIAHAHRSATLALANLQMLGGNVLNGDSLGAFGLLLEHGQDPRTTEAVLAPMQPLLQVSRGKELAHTAWAFLEFGPKISTVADRLFIHPNTLRQRMHRISSVLGAHWVSGPERLGIHIALRAFVLQERVQEVSDS